MKTMLRHSLLVILMFFLFDVLVQAKEPAEIAAHRLKGFPSRLFVFKEKPAEVTDYEFNRLITQIELRLRKSGFHVKSGSPEEYATFIKNMSVTSKTPTVIPKESYALLIELNVLRLKKSTGYVYSTEVSALSSGYFLAKDGPYEVARCSLDGSKRLLLGNARSHCVELYASGGTIGISTKWSDIADVTLHEVDKFINAWLEANPR